MRRSVSGGWTVAKGTLAILASLALVIATLIPAEASHTGSRHWPKNGLARPQIYFVDHTGPAWPVARSTYKWNEVSGIDSYYETSCPSSGLECVDVYEYTSGNPPSCDLSGKAFGCYRSGFVSTGSSHMKWAAVYLNETTVAGYDQHRKSSCHELGHVLGLEHRFTNASCMTQGEAPPISLYPDDHDRSSLTSLYNHSN